MTKLAPHWQPYHYSAQDRDWLASWRPRSVKIVWENTPPYLVDIPPDALIIVRDYPLSENWQQRGFANANHARDMGIAHAEKCREIANGIVDKYGYPTIRLAFEGLNEPQLWGSEPPALTAAYYAAFLTRLHQYGLRGVALNLSVGWPGNSGEGRPPEWAPFAPVLAAMTAGDFLGLHEYWPLSGPGVQWGWLAGRYTQCPWNVPILLTEVGIDNAVADGKHAGWMALPGSMDQKAATYIKQLLWYDERLALDTRIQGAHMFTHDIGSADWATFNTKTDVFMRPFLAAIPHDEPVPEPEPPAQGITPIRWNAEEAVREIEAGLARLDVAIDSLEIMLVGLESLRADVMDSRQRLLENVVGPLNKLEEAG